MPKLFVALLEVKASGLPFKGVERHAVGAQVAGFLFCGGQQLAAHPLVPGRLVHKQQLHRQPL